MSTRLVNRIEETQDDIAKLMERRDDLLDKLVRVQSKLSEAIKDHRRLQNRRRKKQDQEQEALAEPDELADDLSDLIRTERSNGSKMSPEHRAVLRGHPRWSV
jgi:chromosome segregation ATPase